jgi:hemerythrin-like domain-containing protein
MLRDLLTDDHRHCDDLLAAAEAAAAKGDSASALASLKQFQTGMLAHFAAEERLLFPAFEVRTGMTEGPTQVMRMEHIQMRALMDAAVNALQAGDFDEYFGQAETLVIMMQQHNMKEENVLYPMCDQHLSGEAAALSERIREALAAA